MNYYIVLRASGYIILGLILINSILVINGHIYFRKLRSTPIPRINGEYPFVSILIPAHNEGKVLNATLSSLLKLDYPRLQYEIIVINDNSTDNSKCILEKIKRDHSNYNIILIHTDVTNGGKGKSNALNIGLQKSKGEYIVVYDADNMPELHSLKYLVATIYNNPNYGVVVGKFRTINRDVNWLTRCINIETLSFQWMVQAGRWYLLKLTTIPGTNFIIRRSILEELGGWDPRSVAEDTEISMRIHKMGYLIRFAPYAVTWEQEPQTLNVWFRQRARWFKGNIYVIFKFLPYLLDFSPKMLKIKFDIIYLIYIYCLLWECIVFSDIVFISTLLRQRHIGVGGIGNFLWGVEIILFISIVYLSIFPEKEEFTIKNLPIILVIYFIYSKIWVIVSIYGFGLYIKERLLRRDTSWYKTERF